MTFREFVALTGLYAMLIQPVQAQTVPGGGQLTILVLRGDHVVNNTRSQIATAPVVEVRDSNQLPVEGATVTFQLPLSGPGGFFFGSQTTQTTKTNGRGQAAANNFGVNNQTGEFKIKVTATLGGATATTYVSQTNSATKYAAVAPPRAHHITWWEVAIVAGAGAGIALGLLTRSSGSGSTPQPVTITTGGITITGAH